MEQNTNEKVELMILTFTKKDWIFCIALTLLYACIALTNVGSNKTPENGYTLKEGGAPAVIGFEQEEDIAQIWVYSGISEGNLKVTSEDGQELDYEQKFGKMYRYANIGGDFHTKQLTFSSESGDLEILEIVFWNAQGEQIRGYLAAGDPEASNLLDESDHVPKRPTFTDGMYFDELYHARTGYEYIHGMEPYETVHPPLGKVLISFGIRMFGMNPFGWRIMGVMFGIFMVPVMYVFGKRLFRKSEYALLASFLFTFDFMHYTQSRIATLDVFAVFFILLMYYFMYEYYTMDFYRDGLKKTLRPLALSGVFFAIGVAVKWIGIYAGAGLAVIFFTSLIQRYLRYRRLKTAGDESAPEMGRIFKKNAWILIGWCVLFFIALPIGVYLLAYIPYFNIGYDLKGIWDCQVTMYSYHSTLEATHPYQSLAIEWPYILRPVWYFMGAFEPEGSVATISVMGNPAVWWICSTGTIVLIAALCLRKIKGNPAIFVSLVGIASNFVPWLLIRRCIFIYHFFATVPFILLATVCLLFELEKKYPKLAWVKWAWMGLALALFILFFPVISGVECSTAYSDALEWLPGWTFRGV